MSASPELLASIEGLYSAFSGYPLPEKIKCCPCGCNRAEHAPILFSKPLREMRREELDSYAFCALSTMGIESDFKHFLPRLFELSVSVAQDLRLITDFEVVSGKLAYGGWTSWPAAEQIAVRKVFWALWRDLLDQSPEEFEFPETESWLCSIASAEADIAPYLDHWVEAESIHASLRLANMLLDSDIPKRNKPERMTYWGRCENQYAQLQRWIRSPEVFAKLESAARLWADTTAHERLLAALAVVSA